MEDALWNINTGLLDEIEFYNDLNVDAIAIFEPDATTNILLAYKLNFLLSYYHEYCHEQQYDE